MGDEAATDRRYPVGLTMAEVEALRELLRKAEHAAVQAAPESTSTLGNGEEEAAEIEGLRNVVGAHPVPVDEFEAEVMARAAIQADVERVADEEGRKVWADAGIDLSEKIEALAPPGFGEFIQSERDHYTPPSPAFDPRAATQTCAHKGCRRKAYASCANSEGDRWLACAEHYEQDLAAQARAGGHEPAWRVPIGPGVILERWRGGPIGVKVDGELRCYVTAGELARIFEGPVD
jgi:hypothetical protein